MGPMTRAAGAAVAARTQGRRSGERFGRYEVPSRKPHRSSVFITRIAQRSQHIMSPSSDHAWHLEYCSNTGEGCTQSRARPRPWASTGVASVRCLPPALSQPCATPTGRTRVNSRCAAPPWSKRARDSTPHRTEHRRVDAPSRAVERAEIRPVDAAAHRVGGWPIGATCGERPGAAPGPLARAPRSVGHSQRTERPTPHRYRWCRAAPAAGWPAGRHQRSPEPRGPSPRESGASATPSHPCDPSSLAYHDADACEDTPVFEPLCPPACPFKEFANGIGYAMLARCGATIQGSPLPTAVVAWKCTTPEGHPGSHRDAQGGWSSRVSSAGSRGQGTPAAPCPTFRAASCLRAPTLLRRSPQLSHKRGDRSRAADTTVVAAEQSAAEQVGMSG
jgi:hypothetical protein